MIRIDQKWFSSTTLIGGGGTVLVGFSSDKPKTVFRFPWRTLPSWNPSEDRWEARVRPGFVNGLDPVAHGYLSSDTTQVVHEVDLFDDPFMPLNSFRTVPSEGSPLPGFFKALGVRDALSDIEISPTGGIVINETPDAADALPERFLRAVDFYVAVSRATYKSVITPLDPTGFSGVVVDYGVTFDTTNLDRNGIRPRLMQSSLFPEVKPPTWGDRFNAVFSDEGEDRQLISTVYLLSPPNEDGEPNAFWTPYVQHHCFWNLCHAAKNLPPPRPIPPIRIFTGLAFGLLDSIGNEMLSGINELTSKLNNAVNTTTNAGKFWSI